MAFRDSLPARDPTAEEFRDRVPRLSESQIRSSNADLLETERREVLGWICTTEGSRERMLGLRSEVSSNKLDLLASDRAEVRAWLSVLVKTSEGAARVETWLRTRESASVSGNLEDLRLVVL